MKRWSPLVLLGLFGLGCDLFPDPLDVLDDEADDGATQSDGLCLLKDSTPTCDLIDDPHCCDENSIGCNGMQLTNNGGSCDVQPTEGQDCYMQNIYSPYLCCNTYGGLGEVGTVSTSCIDSGFEPCSSDASCWIGETCQFVEFSMQYWCDTSTPGFACTRPYQTPGTLGCCPGLVVGDDGYCGLQSGAACLEDRECATRICVRGETTATCQ